LITYKTDDIHAQSWAYDFKKYTDILQGIKYFIAGGSIRDICSVGYFTSDIDIYFPDRYNIAKAIKALRKHGGKVSFTNKQITNIYLKGQKIQIIKHYMYDTADNVMKNFDFTICCGIYDGSNFYFHDDYFIDLSAKRLVINTINLPLPLNTLERVIRYVKKGYHICNGNLLKLSQAIAKVNFNDPNQNLFMFYPNGDVKFLSID